MATSGITIAGIKYMYLSSNDKVIRAKKGMNGVHTIKTTQSKLQAGISKSGFYSERAGEFVISWNRRTKLFSWDKVWIIFFILNSSNHVK